MNWVIVGLGLASGLIGTVLLAVVEFGAWALATPSRRLESSFDPNTNEEAAAAEPIVARATDGATLAGRWLPAPGAPTGRTMLLVHGFADGSKAMFADRGRAIIDHGWNVAALDLRGYGESGGAFSSFGGREAGDLCVWLDVLADRRPAGEPFVPVVWGRSMGAAIALRAGVADDRIRALVLEAPMVDLTAAVAAWFRGRRVPCAPLLSRLIVRRAGRIAGMSLDRPRPLDLAARFDRPVVIVHGRDDTLIPSVSARNLAAAFPAPAEFIEVPAARHSDVASVGGPELLEKVLAFVEAKCGSVAGG